MLLRRERSDDAEKLSGEFHDRAKAQGNAFLMKRVSLGFGFGNVNSMSILDMYTHVRARAHTHVHMGGAIVLIRIYDIVPYRDLFTLRFAQCINNLPVFICRAQHISRKVYFVFLRAPRDYPPRSILFP